MLNGAGVVAVVRQLEPAAVPEHVGMDGKAHGGLLPRSRQKLPKPGRRHGSATLAREDIRATGRSFPLQLPQGAKFRTPQGMHARRSLLESVDMEHPPFQVHLIPAERHQFRHPKTVPVRQEDQGRVAVAVPPSRLGRAHQLFHLALGEVFPAPALMVRDPSRRDCPILDGRRGGSGHRVHAGFWMVDGGLLSR